MSRLSLESLSSECERLTLDGVWLFTGIWMPFAGVGLALFLFELHMLEHHITRQDLRIKI
jgi:hypothetical protein